MKLVTRAIVPVVTVLVAAGLLISSPAAAYPPSCRQTFSSSTNVHAPPGATTIGTLAVGVTGTVADVDVVVYTDSFSGTEVFLDTAASLPAQQSELLSSTGGTFDGATFDDEAPGPVPVTGSPYAGHYRPVTPLSALDGLQSAGTWRLKVANTNGNTTVNVNAWMITITFAGCVPDSDSDGVPDARDACPAKAAHTASGCPLAARSLSAKYKSGKFRGALASTVPGCRASRAVTIWQVHSGPDRKAGAATTHADGSYVLARRKKAAKYYGTSPRVVVAKVAECPAVKSPTFRVR